MISHDEAEALAERAAVKAVAATLKMLGVNVEDATQLARWQDNFNFVDRANRGSRLVKNTVTRTCIGALLATAFTAFGIGIKDMFFK